MLTPSQGKTSLYFTAFYIMKRSFSSVTGLGGRLFLMLGTDQLVHCSLHASLPLSSPLQQRVDNMP